MIVSRTNVGRMAERIVSNELEYRGFRVSDLNRDGLSANSDLLAAKDGRTIQIQVKGATEEGGWWFGYGHCKQTNIDREQPLFNASRLFYRADLVVLVSIKSPAEYRCLVLPVDIAECAAQLNLDYAFRIPKDDGSQKKPGKMWVWLDRIPNVRNKSKIPIYEAERALLMPYVGAWQLADALLASAASPLVDRDEQ